MSTNELRSDLLAIISTIEDIDLLKKLKQYLKIELEAKDDVYILSERQLSALNKSLEQYENGQFLTEEEAEKDLDKWFKEEEKKLSGH